MSSDSSYDTAGPTGPDSDLKDKLAAATGQSNPYTQFTDESLLPLTGSSLVSFNHSSGHVELPEYVNDSRIRSEPCDKRSRWIVPAVVLIAFGILATVLGCVYLIHLHPDSHPRKDPVDVCDRIFCHNGGTCLDQTNPVKCLCPGGFSGQLCEIERNLCDDDPCLNEGICVTTGSGVKCHCLYGFTGRRCDSDVNECVSNPCANGATCTNGNDEYKCQCMMGYTGTRCEQEINECSSSPCNGTSTCHDVTNGYLCQCPYGVTGKHCEKEIGNCWSNPCSNGGTCHENKMSFKCLCKPGFTGFFCQSDVHDCLFDPCTNGATCHNVPNGPFCQCRPGYTGRYCESAIDECQSDPCENNGTCVNGLNGFVCLCGTGSTGPRCESEISPLGVCPPGFLSYPENSRCYFVAKNKSQELAFHQAEDFCVSKGATLTSIETDAEMLFIRNSAYTGRYYYVSAMRRKDNHIYWNTGSVLDSNDSTWSFGHPISTRDCVVLHWSRLYSTECTLDRYFICERSIIYKNDTDSCLSFPCFNGATCHSLTDNFQCECTPGFTGQFCEIDLDDCESMPCENGGTCVRHRGTYQCLCPDGYNGTDCKTNVDECAENPCHHGSTCIDGIANFKCVCDSNHTGALCDTGIDDVCFAGFIFYSRTVKCYYIKEDPNSELSLKDAKTACEKIGGSLASLETYDELQFVGSHFKRQEKYHWLGAEKKFYQFTWYSGVLIPRNYSGWSSAQRYRSGSSVVAVMKNNVTAIRSAYSHYRYPYICEMGIRYPPGTTDCSSMPCLNDATCVNGNDRYTCVCEPGFTGTHCETDLDECASSPCFNGGNCTNGMGQFHCICVGGYTGTMCETNIDECASNPCYHGSTCVNGLHKYICICPVNFTGRTCKSDLNKECPVGFTRDIHNARCYLIQEVASEQRSYGSAKNFCESKGADLASLETHQELLYVISRFQWSGRYHILGAQAEASAGHFRWLSGEILENGDPDWAPSEPLPGNECVAGIAGRNNTYSLLYSLNCTLERPFVCEIGPR